MLAFRSGLFSAVMALVAVFGLAPAHAKMPGINTPPSAIDSPSESELNALGMALLADVYTFHAALADTAKDGIPAPEQVDPAVLRRIKDLYDDDALIQRSRLNHGLTKATFFPHFINQFTISDMVITRSGTKVLVLTYNIALPNRTTLRAGVVMSGESQPRIVVMRWREEARMWKIFFYADFDLPRAMLCDAEPEYVPKKSTFKPEDVALAKELSRKIQQASLDGTEKSVQSQGFQYVFASGERKTGGGAVCARITKLFEPMNVEAIRSGDLFVMRSDPDNPTLTIDGQGIVPEMRPGIATFIRDADGEWRMIAIGIFAITARVAKNTPCEDAPAQ